MYKKLIIVVAAFAWSVFPLQAVVLIEENFDTDRAGGKPRADQVHMPADTKVVIVDGAATPADPFGGELNRSLLIEDSGAGGPSAGWPTDGLEVETGNLILSMKTYIVDDKEWDDTYLTIQAGQNNAKKSTLNSLEAAVQLTLRNNKIQMRSGGSVLTAKEDFDRNTVWDIQIIIQPGERTWSATINGTPLEYGRETVFDFRNNSAVEGINFISLTGQSTAAGQRIFFDDLKLERAE